MHDPDRYSTPSKSKLFCLFVDFQTVLSCVLIIPFLLLSGVMLNQSYIAYRDNGILTTGEIMEIVPRRTRNSAYYEHIKEGNLGYIRLNLVVSHMLDDGEYELTLVHTGYAFSKALSEIALAFPALSFLGYEVGDELEFSYLKNRTYQGSTEWFSGRIVAIFLWLLGFAAPYIAWATIREAIEDASAAHRAITADSREKAYVTKIANYNKKMFYSVLHWVDEQGKSGKTRAHPNVKFEKLQVGSRIMIYRDDERAWWEGDLNMTKR